MTIIVSTTASAAARDYSWLLASIGAWNGNQMDLTSLIPGPAMLGIIRSGKSVRYVRPNVERGWLLVGSNLVRVTLPSLAPVENG